MKSAPGFPLCQTIARVLAGAIDPPVGALTKRAEKVLQDARLD
jgi:hypothetical protein